MWMFSSGLPLMASLIGSKLGMAPCYLHGHRLYIFRFNLNINFKDTINCFLKTLTFKVSLSQMYSAVSCHLYSMKCVCDIFLCFFIWCQSYRSQQVHWGRLRVLIKEQNKFRLSSQECFSATLFGINFCPKNRCQTRSAVAVWRL